MSTSRFGNRPKATFTGSGPGRPPQQVAGFLVNYHVGPQPDPKNDHVDLAIIHPIMDKDGNVIFPKYDENGNPSTIIKMYQQTPPELMKRAANLQPRTIHGLTKTRGSGAAIMPGGVVYFHGVYPQADGTYRAQGAHGIASVEDLSPRENKVTGVETPAAKIVPENVFIQVRPVSRDARARFKADGTNARQTVMIFEPMNAIPLEADANGSFISAIKQMIEENRNYANGYNVPGAFAIIARSIEPQEESWRDRIGNCLKISTEKKDGTNDYAMIDADTALERFLKASKASPISQDLPEILSGELKGYTVTYVPGLAPAQGAGLSPCSTTDNGRVPFDRSETCRIFDTDPDTGKTIVVDRGVTPGFVSLAYVQNGETYMFNLHEQSIRGYSFTIGDMPTPDMAEWHREAALAYGLGNIEEARKYGQQIKNSQANEHEPDPQHENSGTGSASGVGGTDPGEVPF